LKHNFMAITAITAILLAGPAFGGTAESLRFAALDIDMGARAAGMAGAFTAISDDASAIFYNPAGLARIKTIELNAAYDKWLLDSAFQYGNVALPVGFGAIGGMFTYTDYGTFKARGDDGNLIDQDIKPYNLSGALGYGLPLGDIFSFGATFRYSGITIDTYSASLFTFDAGLMANIADIVSIGAALQNMDTNFSPGYNIRGGIGVTAFNIQDNYLKFALDAKYSGVYGMSYAAGMEISLFKSLAIRAGYNFSGSNSVLGGISGLCLGAGVTIDKLSFDYAFTSRGDLGMTHLVGIKLLYESSEEKDRKNYQKMTEFLAYQSYKDGEDAFNNGNYRRALAYWEDVKSSVPEYEGIDEAILKAKRFIESGGSVKKAQSLFDDGMKAYEAFDFDKAAKKWADVKKMYPAFKDIDLWLGDARELRNSKGMSKQAEKYFREGIKYYNNCDYGKALTSWERGLEKDPNNKKIGQYIERTKAKQVEIKEGISRAKADVANDSTVIEGIKRLRDISNVCPAYQDAMDILSTLKGMIAVKTRDYYFKGIEKYTQGNLDAAIIYWTNIESLDPQSEYLLKVKRYITDARNKQKAIEGFEKKKKK
jgi:tetratricopeptide (TPR) repeat protein